jgi:nitrogen fixation protein NifQ
MNAIGYVELMDAAAHPDHSVTLAFAGVMALGVQRRPPYDVPIAGVDTSELAAILGHYFPDLRAPIAGTAIRADDVSRIDEFDDLVALLLEHRSFDDEETHWLAYAIATACMGENHLWQDMGLPNRNVLSWLIKHYFTRLAARNTGDMRWKKFFYRELCERAEVLACKSPSCGECVDYAVCFEPAEAVRADTIPSGGRRVPL